MTERTPKYTQGAYLRELRERHGLTIPALAELAGVSEAYIYKIERGIQHLTKPETVERFAALLGITADDLYASDGALHPAVIAFMAANPSTIRAVRKVMEQAK